LSDTDGVVARQGIGPPIRKFVREAAADRRRRRSRHVVPAASLIKKGLVRGQTDARDGRKLLLTLTREGRALYAKVVPEARRRQSHLLAALSTDERRVFEAALEKLQNRASEMLTW
jgi:DNA-binding MarR family transcriptional regulator